MYNASHVKEVIDEASNFGFDVESPKFDWGKMKAYRDRYISRLNDIYTSGLDKLNVTRISGMASFEDDHTVRVGSQLYTAKHILIAVGGEPNDLGVPGDELAITSDGFFELPNQPKKVAVIGAGYIAVELAGVFNGLGTDTSLFVRGNHALRNFDSMLSEHLDKSMKHAGDSYQ
jgi:glutathione reductase (NADPH)